MPAIVISSLRLSFNEQIPEIHVYHSYNDLDGVQKISQSVSTKEADLSLQPGQTKVLEFSFTPIAQTQIEEYLFHALG